MRKNKHNYKRIVLIALTVLVVVIIFAFADYLFHLLKEEYAVPSRYFTNKIIYGTIIGLITYYFIRDKKPVIKSLIFSGIISVLLQIRYFLEGYNLDFIILFLFIHFAILLIVSYLSFKILDGKHTIK